VNQSLRHGRAAGLLTVAGNTTGLTVWACASVVGLTALITASTIALIVLKIVGAGYLCWVGVRTLLLSLRGGDAPRAAAEAREGSLPQQRSAPYRAGLLTNLTNPKPAAFYLALLPQFLPSGAGPGDILVLASIHTAMSASWYAGLAATAAAARSWLGSAHIRRLLDRGTSIVLIGLGLRLLTVGPDGWIRHG
jgi:threonine/homoserine/homoserine lactone efflux protein